MGLAHFSWLRCYLPRHPQQRERGGHNLILRPWVHTESVLHAAHGAAVAAHPTPLLKTAGKRVVAKVSLRPGEGEKSAITA